MEHHKVPLRQTKSFSPAFLDYAEQSPSLKPFYHRFPTVENFLHQLEEKGKSFSGASRELLVKVLQQQYTSLQPPEVVRENITRLAQKKTFTITTGHQLNIFTGPLYFIYKIITVINTCKQLNERYPKFHFVPVYWMASEDHDFEEISYFRLHSNKYVWSTEQTGAVGRFNPTELKSLVAEIPGDIELFNRAYLMSKTLSDAVRSYVNELFGDQGLVVIDADDRELKRTFIPVIKDDLFKHTAEEKVGATNAALARAGHEAKVNPRDINFFYLDAHVRSRIEKRDKDFIVVDTDLKFSEVQINQLIETEPEKFSPNVILRPLYQEMILPNLAYVGGPAEVVYWLELKSAFEHFKTPFPMLMPRNFALVLNGPMTRKFGKTGLTIEQLFEEKNFLFNDWVIRNTHHNLTLTNELNGVTSFFRTIKERALTIDPSLEQLVGAEEKRARNSFEKMETKLLKAEKRLHTDKLRQIEEVKDHLFPNGSLQERTDNFLNFYQQDKDFLNKLISRFDPFDFTFNVLSHPHT